MRHALKSFLFITLFGPFSTLGFSAETPGTLRLGTEGEFRPFNFREAGKLTGFEVELAEKIAEKLKLKPLWTTESFDTLLVSLNLHHYDLVAASHGITPERGKSVDFVLPHYCTGAVIVAKKGGPLQIKDLNGKRIGVTAGTTYLDRVKQIKNLKETKIFPKDQEASQSLLKGNIDVWVTDRFLAIEHLKSIRAKELEIGEILFPETVSMAVAKGDTALKQKVNATLIGLLKDGTYSRLSEKYFGEDIRCKESPADDH